MVAVILSKGQSLVLQADCLPNAQCQNITSNSKCKQSIKNRQHATQNIEVHLNSLQYFYILEQGIWPIKTYFTHG